MRFVELMVALGSVSSDSTALTGWNIRKSCLFLRFLACSSQSGHRKEGFIFALFRLRTDQSSWISWKREFCLYSSGSLFHPHGI